LVKQKSEREWMVGDIMKKNIGDKIGKGQGYGYQQKKEMPLRQINKTDKFMNQKNSENSRKAENSDNAHREKIRNPTDNAGGEDRFESRRLYGNINQYQKQKIEIYFYHIHITVQQYLEYYQKQQEDNLEIPIHRFTITNCLMDLPTKKGLTNTFKSKGSFSVAITLPMGM
jgi:hypothetical protein